MKNRFRVWLDEKGLTTVAFAKATTLSLNTCNHWAIGMFSPCPLAKRLIRQTYPDCPLVK